MTPGLYELIRSGKVKVTQTTSPPEHRFWKKVDKDGPIHPICGQCWRWKGKPSRSGYGQFMVNHRSLRAHRYSYELCIGSIPGGLDVLHRCDNKWCVNPDHLFVGTKQDNQRDKVEKGRQAKGETIGGHKLTDEQIQEIRRRYKLKRGYHDPINGQGALARDFNTTQANISLIVRGKAWKHVS